MYGKLPRLSDLNEFISQFGVKAIEVKEVKVKSKRLKETTIKRYSAKQLAKHLSNLNCERVRVDFDYGSIYWKGFFQCSINAWSKDRIICVIRHAYLSLDI